ncbi:hypothetical protein BH09PLA1_BH09PLA1_27360 [soil metagenome]
MKNSLRSRSSNGSRKGSVWLRQFVESLERRQLLSAPYIDPTFKVLGPQRPEKIELPTSPFQATTGKAVKPRPTAAAGGGGVSINVGPVVNISRATGNRTEADIAINPTNTNQIFAVSNLTSNGLFTSRSNDGGQTWTTATIAPGAGLPTACCDARVRYDYFGNLFMVYLGPSGSNNYIARSVDNGATWTLVDTKTGSYDNPAIDVGYNNQVWIQARGPGGVVGYGGQSNGLGAPITFSAPQVVPTTSSTGSFGDVAVLNDGSVLITYTTPSGGQGPANNPVWRDPDGLGPIGFLGAGGGTSTPLFNPVTNVGGFDFIPAQNSRSVDSEPNFAVAPPNSVFAGRVYFIYAQETVPENNDHDIVVRYSDNSGTTWSNEIRVNDDPASPIRSQFLAQIAVDPTTGAIVASWHDARNDNGVVPNGTNAVQNDDAQFYGALSTDGGATWTNFNIDPGWSNAARAANGIDFGDWTGSDFQNGRFFAVWASNAQGVNGLPNNPSPNQFDLATARVDIVGAGLPGIYGLVVNDANGNGVRDGGEVGLSGVTVYLDANNNGNFDGGETNVVTGNAGSYAFQSLPAATYRVRAVTPAGQRATFPAGGVYVINYDGTTSVVGQDFGFVNPRITGTVFSDTNDNGVFNSGEPGLAGVTVYNDANNNNTFDGGELNTMSAADGTYTLAGLADGAYIIRVVRPSGRRLTLPGSGVYNATISNANLVYAARDFGLTDRVRIAGSVYRDANGNGVRDGGEIPYVGTRVYQDLNNNGTFDNTGGTFASSDVPKSILDNTTINSSLLISGGGNINNLTVQLNITHTFDGDLVLSLISPIGTVVTLANRRGGSGDNFTNTIFDDSAATSITAGTAPFAGSYRPETPLSALNGQNANGTWLLRVQDAATQDTGTLNSWSITFGSTEPNVLTDASGAYSFPGLSAGTYNLRTEPPANTVFTNPANGLRTFNAVGGDLLTGDFGLFSTAYTGQDITLRLDPTSTNVQIWVDQPVAGAPTYTAAKAILSTLTFTGTSGDDSLTIDAANGNPVPSGGVTYNGLGQGALGDALIVNGSAGADNVAFSVSGATFNGLAVATTSVERARFDGRNGGDTLTVSGGPNVGMGVTQHLASISIASGASASVDTGTNAVIVTSSLTVNGQFDLADNDLLAFYSGSSVLPSIQTLINTARNGGTWNGATGLTSTAAKNRSPKSTTLGAMESTDYKSVYGPAATFDGEALPGNSVLVKYTYYGDADFNGIVNFDDYSRTDAGFNGNRTGWLNGDYDGNGIVNFDDYSLIDLAFNSQLGAL